MDVAAVILAGGMGTRLHDTVPGLPKVLAPVGGRPFLAYIFKQLQQAGIYSAILCTGFEGKAVSDTFGRDYEGMTLYYSHEGTPAGTAGALLLAMRLVKAPWWLILNGDSYCHTNLTDFCKSALEQNQPTLLLTHVEDTGRYGRVIQDNSGRIVRFEEKQAEGSPGWINAGVYLLPVEYIKTIPAGREVSLEKEMFPAWVERGLFGLRSYAAFIDIGTPDSYADAKRFFQGQK